MSDSNQQSQARETEQEENRERRIRERAYFIWQEEGRQEGRQLEHWDRAHARIDEEDGTGPWVERGC
jgi:Protein of unknown function (DUF2934)